MNLKCVKCFIIVWNECEYVIWYVIKQTTNALEYSHVVGTVTETTIFVLNKNNVLGTSIQCTNATGAIPHTTVEILV